MIAALVVLSASNCASLVWLLAALRRKAGPARYHIVESYDGEHLEGPMTLREAERAQKRWYRLHVYSGGPRTKVATVERGDGYGY